ncbi:MAG: response regulator [Dehalococcoidia bacterium]
MPEQPCEYGVGRVLIVDDDDSNRLLLRDLLGSDGHTVMEATSGEEALARLNDSATDLVLLDLMMPGMDGFEACRRIKGNSQTMHLPVLVITALNERKDKIAGMRAGANDFITKPVDTQDVRLRVRNAVAAKQLFDELQASYSRLKGLEAMRDSLTQMIVHDLRSPLTGIDSFLSLLSRRAADRLDERDILLVQQARIATGRLVDMISSVLDVSRLEAGAMPLDIARCDLTAVVGEAIESPGLPQGSAAIAHDLPARPVFVSCDSEIIRRVVVNLLDNALKFTPARGEVRIEMSVDEGQPTVAVVDQGPGIPPEYREKVFEKFGQIESREQGRKYSSGLGLAFCKMAVEAHGGSIGVESEVARGSRFWFKLPAAELASHAESA